MAMVSLWQIAAVGGSPSESRRSPARWPPSIEMRSRTISDGGGARLVPAERLLVPVLAAGEGRLVARGDDQGNASMTEPGEIRDDLRGGARPIDPHRRDLPTVDLAVEEHHRDARAPAEGRQLVGPAPRRAEDQAVGAALEEMLDVAPLDLGVAAAARQKEAIAQGRQDVLGAAHDVRKERTGHVADHDTHRVGLAAREASRDVVGMEAQLGDGALHARPGRGRDRELAVDHARDRLVRDERAPPDVPDRRALLLERDRHSWHPPGGVRGLVTGHKLAVGSPRCQ